MRKIMIACLAVLSVAGMRETVQAQAAPSCAAKTGKNATFLFPADFASDLGGTALQNGDVVTAHTPDGRCVGRLVWTAGAAQAITVWSDDEGTDEIEGMRPGEHVWFQVYEASAGITHAQTTVQYGQGSAAYEVDGIYGLTALASASLSKVVPVAEPDGQAVVLTWSVPGARNDAGFEVERAAGAGATAGAYERIGFVEGQGTTVEATHYTFRAEGLSTGPHRLRLKQVNRDGTVQYSAEVEVSVELPDALVMEAAYPNPFNPETTMRFSVKQSQQVRVELYNTLGQRVQLLHDGVVEANQMQTVRIDGSVLASGMYLIRLMGDGLHAVQQVTLLK